MKKTKNGKTKKRLNKFKVMVVLVVIVVIGLILNRKDAKQNESEAISTLSMFMSYINEENYEEMYDMLSASSKENITKEDFIKKYQDIYGKLEVRDVSMRDMSEELEDEGKKSKIAFSIQMETLAGSLKFANTIRIENEKR